MNQKYAVFSILIATFAITLNDAFVKLLSEDYSLHQIIFVRSIIALSITLLIVVPFEGGFKSLKTKRVTFHIARGAAIVAANATFFAGLAVLPIGTAVAVFFVAPILIATFSTILLREQVNFYRWISLFIGLVGVFLIVKPGTTHFEWTFLLPILAAVFYAIVNTLTRSVGVTESASSLSVYIQLSFLVMSIILGVIFGQGHYFEPGHPSLEFFTRAWSIPSKTHVILILILGGICAAAGGFFIAQAYRYGSAGLVTPFEYSALIMAVLWGFVFWREIPDLVSGFGMVLILGSGVFVLILEAKYDFRITVSQWIRRSLLFKND